MRVGIIISLFVLIITFANCKKGDDNASLPTANTWIIEPNRIFHEQTSHWLTPSYGGDSLYHLAISDSTNNNTGTINYLTLTFTKKPSGNKQYKIVYQPKADDEVSIYAWSSIGGNASSQDGSGNYLSVTDANGRLTFTVGKAKLHVYTWVVDYDEDLSVNITSDD